MVGEDGMFSWLSSKRAEAFGSEMASLVMSMMPKETVLNDSKRNSKANYAREKMKKRIRQFSQEEIMNFYKVARLLNKFKWTLKDAGYDSALAETFASFILINLRSGGR